MDYSCLFPQCKQLLFDGFCLGRSSLLNTNSPAQLCLMLHREAGMMSSPRITDRASGSHLLSAVRHNDGVWSEVSLNLNQSFRRGVVEQTGRECSGRKVLMAFECKGLSYKSVGSWRGNGVTKGMQKHCHLLSRAVMH